MTEADRRSSIGEALDILMQASQNRFDIAAVEGSVQSPQRLVFVTHPGNRSNTGTPSGT